MGRWDGLRYVEELESKAASSYPSLGPRPVEFKFCSTCCHINEIELPSISRPKIMEAATKQGHGQPPVRLSELPVALQPRRCRPLIGHY